MLDLHFINVGDGDAILVEERNGDEVFRLLVDTGRADAGAYPGSRRLTAGAYLRERGIARLDALVITRLHEDHFAGLAGVLETAEIETVYSGFFPDAPVRAIARTGTEEKTVKGLINCLERWSVLTEAMRAKGCRLRQMEETLPLRLTPRLRGELILAGSEAAARQRQVWTALLKGGRTDRDMVWWSSKYRNPGALRARLYYAGRRIELAGDCYGAAWEDRAEKCDIFKVPHHGDAKSVTPALLQRLRPLHAVISCPAEYIPRKDRPSLAAIGLLEEWGAQVWFTDSFARRENPPDCWASVDFTIREDGTILPPARN